MKNLLKWLVVGLALACGAPLDVETDDAGIAQVDQGSDIGQTEQKLAVSAHNYGKSTAASGLRCNDTNSGQSCVLPRARDYVWCMVDSGFNATEQSDIRAGFTMANGLMPNRFTFTELTGVAQCTQVSPAPGIVVKKGLCSGGSTSGTVESFVCPTLQPVFALTESVPGTWQSFGGSTTVSSILTVDTADINVQPAGHFTGDTAAAEQGCLRRFGITHWAFAAFAGGGAADSSPANDAFSQSVAGRQLRSPVNVGQPATDICQWTNTDPIVPAFSKKHQALSSNETCEMRSYSNGTPGSFAFTGTVCP